MPISRRTILRAATVGGVAAAAATATGVALAGSGEPAKRSIVRPPRLREGDRVRIVSPGSTPDPALMARGIAVLESFGLKVELGKPADRSDRNHGHHGRRRRHRSHRNRRSVALCGSA